jgi:DNA-directed RNA polymerase sigma subunit (sigma70/sigma32)
MSQIGEQVQRLNLFPEDLYKTPHRVSDLLRESGLSEQELQQLHSNALERYVPELLLRWRNLFTDLFRNQRRTDILIRRYGLDGAPALTLQQLGEAHGISRERIRQLQNGALNRLRTPTRRQALEQIALEVAQEVLRQIAAESMADKTQVAT